MDVATIGLRAESTQIGRARDELGRFTKSAKAADKANDNLSRATDRVSRSMGTMRRRVASLVSIAAITGIVTQATSAFMKFDEALGEVSTLIEGTEREMAFLESRARSMAKTFGTTATAQVNAFYQAISAGAGSVEEAAKTLEVANKLAVGGVTSVQVATDGLTSVMNAYGDQVESATAVSDAMFVAMRAGKTTIGELSSALGRVAPLAATVGVSFDELSASIAALTKGGIATNEAVTGVRAILAAVAKPTAEATKLAKALGLEFNTAALNAKGFQGFLQEVAEKTGGSTDALAMLFGGVEALTPMLALAGQAGEDFNAIMVEMGVKTGATDDAFDKIAQTASFKFRVEMQKVSDLLVQIGAKVLPTVVTSLEMLNKLLDRFVVGASASLGVASRSISDVKSEIQELQATLAELEGKRNSFYFGDLEGSIASTKARIAELTAMLPALEEANRIAARSARQTVPNIDAQWKSGSSALQSYVDSVVLGLKTTETAKEAAANSTYDLVKLWDDATRSQQQATDAMADARAITKGFLSDLRNGIQQGKDFWDSMKDAALNALNSIADKLFEVATSQLISAVLGGMTGGVGVGADPWAGLRVVGAAARGTNNAPGGTMLVGERGPELVNIPRGAKVTPANETANMLGKGASDGGFSPTINIDARGAGPGVEQKIRSEVDSALANYASGEYDRFRANHERALKRDYRYRNG